jgi:hypothetical protein
MKALGRLLILISLLLVLAIVPVLFLGSNWPTNNLVQSLICGEDKFLTETTQTQTQIGNSNIARVKIGTTAACVNEATGTQTDALSKFMIIAAIAFIVPFALGMTLNGIGSAMAQAGGNFGEMRAIAQLPDVQAKSKEWQQAVRSGQMSVEEYSQRVKALYEEKAVERAASPTVTDL